MAAFFFPAALAFWEKFNILGEVRIHKNKFTLKSLLVRLTPNPLLLLLLPSRFSRVRLCAAPWTAARRLLCPWDSPGKTTGVGCQFLLQHMHAC